MNRKLDYKPISNRVLINDVQSNNSTAVLYFYDMTCKVINDVIQNKFRSLYKLRWDIYNDAYIELQVENWKILSDLKHVYYGDVDHPVPGQIDHWVS